MTAYTVVGRTAVLSPCERYRYHLTRTLDQGQGDALFIMLNPSTADAAIDDPTIRRCMGFAHAWGLNRVVVVNLFSWRSPSPKDLPKATDPVGPETDRHLMEAAAEASTIVCAWGTEGTLQGRDQAVRDLLIQAGHRPHYLKLTAAGHPSHPLYLKRTLVPQPWQLDRAELR